MVEIGVEHAGAFLGPQQVLRDAVDLIVEAALRKAEQLVDEVV
jgi:hypothetical protein